MPNDKPLVSIIMPAFNAAPYIAAALDSALAQTYPNKEIVVVDDGSTDGTGAIVEPYVRKKLVTYVRQGNQGSSAARNAAIALSHGVFLAFCDADDVLFPQKVEKQVQFLIDHPEYGMTYCDVWHFKDEEPNKLMFLKGDYFSGNDVLPGLFKKNFIITLSVVLRRSAFDAVGGFNEKLRRSEDWELWFRLVHSGIGIYHLAEPLAKCRLHIGSLSRGTDGWGTRIKERRSVLALVQSFYAVMTPEERKRYRLKRIIWKHRLKLWYVVFGNYFPPLRWLADLLQSGRWEEVRRRPAL